jgi:hypothetical protein
MAVCRKTVKAEKAEKGGDEARCTDTRLRLI